MNCKPIKAVMLRNNDKFIDVDGVITVTNFKMNFLKDIVTFTATKPDGSVSQRCVEMNQLVNKVVG